MMKSEYDLVVAGAGAAGFFAAINYKILHPDHDVVIIEKISKILSKVKISGGGRCNVTNICAPEHFLANYPRGEKELRQVFTKFNNRDTVAWFEQRRVKLKAEEDGRMFPVTDDSQTIIDCLLNECRRLHIEILTSNGLHHFEPKGELWNLTTNTGRCTTKNLLLATGGNTSGNIYELLLKYGHTIVPEIPSLFTFNIPDKKLHELQGLSMADVQVSIESTKLTNTGPLLITHWGMSGPAILKLSAAGARILAEKNYDFSIKVNWIKTANAEVSFELLDQNIRKIPLRQSAQAPEHVQHMPKRLYHYLIEKSGITPTLTWNQVPKTQLRKLAQILFADVYPVKGKSTFKEEFVTAGGISLKSIDMKTMESKHCPGLYFAGELIDVDGYTGGFNFQAAWSTGYAAAQSMR